MDGLTLDLLLAACGVALIHTVLGPDHYLPFVMLSRARKWTMRRTLVITGLCGLGHVGSSILLGGIGLALGSALGKIAWLEEWRGSLAAWALVVFGGAYALWGIRKAWKTRRGFQLHAHDGHTHLHSGAVLPHTHHGHSHEVKPDATFWTLFAVFVLGPCEPLIPLFMLPASQGKWQAAGLTALIFSIVTLVAMLGVTFLLVSGIRRVPLGPLTRWSHAMAGGVICASGLAVLLLGL